jgi:RecB family exonuclease
MTLRSSASQISTFRDCKRKWYIKKVVGIKEPDTPSAAAGRHLHKILERYLKTGELPPQSDEVAVVAGAKEFTHNQCLAMLMPAFEHFPEPGKGEAEGKFEMDLGELGTMIGYIDCAVDEEGLVEDLKTTASFKYLKDEDTLRLDPQVTIYGVVMAERTGRDEVTCRWVYILRDPKRPRAKAVEFNLSAEELDKSWQLVISDLREMKSLVERKPPSLEVECNTLACDKYRGCPYRNTEHCQTSSKERLTTLLRAGREEEEKEMGLGALKKKVDQQKETGPINPPEAAKTAAKTESPAPTGPAITEVEMSAFEPALRAFIVSCMREAMGK